MHDENGPRFTSGEFLEKMIEQARNGPVAFTHEEKPQIVVMLYDTYIEMRDRIRELEQFLPMKQSGHKPFRLNGNGLVSPSDLTAPEGEHESDSEEA